MEEIRFTDDSGIEYKFKIPSEIGVVFVDVDGTLSSHATYHGDGSVSRSYFLRDGAGLRLLRTKNIFPVIMSGESDMSIWSRANQLSVPFFHVPGRGDKKLKRGLEIVDMFEYVSFLGMIGDDLNDLELMLDSDFPACPRNADDEVANYVSESENGFISNYDGGNGAVREWCNWLLNRQSVLDMHNRSGEQLWILK